MEDTKQAVEETVVEETVETTENTPKTFTQEQVNSIAANRAIKERDSIFNELGLGDKYSKDAFELFKTSTKSANDKIASLGDEVNTYKENNENLLKEKTSIEQDLMYNTFSVQDEYKDEFLTLVKSKQNDETDLMAAAAQVAEKFANSFAKPVPKQKDIVIGTNKSTISQKELLEADMERLRNL